MLGPADAGARVVPKAFHHCILSIIISQYKNAFAILQLIQLYINIAVAVYRYMPVAAQLFHNGYSFKTFGQFDADLIRNRASCES